MAKRINVPLTVTELRDLVYQYEKWASNNESCVGDGTPAKYKAEMLGHAERFKARASELKQFLPK